jgi:hypothetical protein
VLRCISIFIMMLWFTRALGAMFLPLLLAWQLVGLGSVLMIAGCFIILNFDHTRVGKVVRAHNVIIGSGRAE